MTTTLRPAGPEETLPDGGRSRSWTVCANGRRVGTVRTGATRYGSHLVGRIEDLEITDGLRRGRGTVAALAAEEVLRAWGCAKSELTVPVTATAAHALALALGYTETSRKLAKRLGRVPTPPPGLTVRPITPEEYPDWLAAIGVEYRAQLVRSGLTEHQAAERSRVDDDRLLPQRHATPGVALRRLLAHGEPVGSLWVALTGIRLPDGRPLGWVMNVEVAAERRGEGFGRELMLTAERECLTAGVRDLGLNVYSANRVAIRLYDSLGYLTTRRVLAKTL
jgi:ribosomal protein S18 acetylase RimI-like enzyme